MYDYDRVSSIIFVFCILTNMIMPVTSQDQIFNGNPIWSPDGQEIVYLSNNYENVDLWIMRADGSDSVNLTTELDDLVFPIYSWSPNGDSIAFISSFGDGSHMWLAHLSELTLEDLTGNFLPSVGGQPEWSENGEYIAFMGENLNDKFATSVWVISLDTKEPVTIDIVEETRSPQWSVDNTLFFTTHSQSGNSLQTVDSKLNNLQNLQIDSIVEFDVSPDGKGFVYTTRKDSIYDVVIYSLDEEREVMRLSGDQLTFVMGLKWSPDGTQVTFSTICDIQLSSSSIWLLDIDDGSLSELVDCEFGDSNSPDWSPDNETIAFQSEIDGYTHVWTININTGEMTNLTASSN